MRENRFLAEVAEQPRALRALLAFYAGEGRGRLKEWARRARKAGRIVFCGMGTSQFAPEAILQRLAALGLDATAEDAGEALHYPRNAPALCVLISQSGESYETRVLAEKLGRAEFVALTNNAASTLGRLAALALPLCAGDEAAISTKTYLNTMALLHLLASSLEGAAQLRKAFAELDKLAGKLAVKPSAQIQAAAADLARAPALQFIARGPALVSARQAALTFMEGTRLPAAALAGGAFRHGPFELVGKGHYAIFFAPVGATFKLIIAMARECVDAGSHVLIITNSGAAMPGCAVLKVPSCAENLFPVAAAPIQELLLEAVAHQRGLVAGQFRHGQKITARE
jgi:glucosamine--fructose-6-phosphate aminotransferase (isomerizing)